MDFRRAIKGLEPLLKKFNEIVDDPILKSQGDFFFYDFEEKDVNTIFLIKVSRILSSLYAIDLLFKIGHVAEVGIIVRTIKEACHELMFLIEDSDDDGFIDKRNLYIEEFFRMEFQNHKEPIKTAKNHNRIPQKRIIASVARSMDKFTNLIEDNNLRKQVQRTLNPSDYQETAKALINSWSGYVHYGYQQSMDIYDSSSKKFDIKGVKSAIRKSEWHSVIITEIEAVYGFFLDYCLKLGLTDTFQEIDTNNKSFKSMFNID